MYKHQKNCFEIHEFQPIIPQGFYINVFVDATVS